MGSQRSDRNSKGKVAMERNTQTPSCFMSPDSPGSRSVFCKEATPQHWSPSSAFLTPPSSQDKLPRHDFCSEGIKDIPKLDYSIGTDEQPKGSEESQRSPLHPVDRIIGTLCLKNVEKIDFVRELLLMGCDQICHKICDFLAADDLRRFAAVSMTWRTFVRRERRIHARWEAHLKECRHLRTLKGKENFGSAKGFTPPRTLPRVALSSLNHNQQQSRSDSTPRTSVAVISSSVNLRPCPQCTSPAETQLGKCCCQECGLLFCSQCLRQMDRHDSTVCQGLYLGQAQTKTTRQSRRNSAYVVGSKKSKQRIRRL